MIEKTSKNMFFDTILYYFSKKDRVYPKNT